MQQPKMRYDELMRSLYEHAIKICRTSACCYTYSSEQFVDQVVDHLVKFTTRQIELISIHLWI